jgi:hypothetical protein
MKDFDSLRHNPDMNIDDRLRQADPAKGFPELDQGLVLNAAERTKAWGRRKASVGQTWEAMQKRRSVMGLSGLATALALVVAVVVVSPSTQPGKAPEALTSEVAGPQAPVTPSSALPTVTQLTGAAATAEYTATLPMLTQAIRYYPYGQYVTKKYNEWSQALAPLGSFSGPALVAFDVKFEPSTALMARKAPSGILYKIRPAVGIQDAASSLKKLFGLGSKLEVSKPGPYGSVTVTAGYVPPTAVLTGIGQAGTEKQYRGIAAIGSANGIRWVYGNSRAMAWRKCQPGDSMNKNVSIISHYANKVSKGCVALPSGLGPTESEAIDRAKLLFQSLGYKTSTSLKATPEGGLFVTTQGFNESLDGRATYYEGTVSGYLKVAGVVTTLAQKVIFTSSSQQIVSAEGFIGNAVPTQLAALKSPALAARQISVYDGDPVNSMNLLDEKHPGWEYIRSDLSTSITKAPPGDATRPNAKPKKIFVTRYRIVPGVIQAYDGSTWLIPTFEFSDRGGYLGAVKGLRGSLLKKYDFPPYALAQKY